MSNLLFFGDYTKAGVGTAPSSPPTITIYSVVRSSGVEASVGSAVATTASALTGRYFYQLASANLQTYDYHARFHTSDSTVDQQDLPALWTRFSEAVTTDSTGGVNATQILSVNAGAFLASANGYSVVTVGTTTPATSDWYTPIAPYGGFPAYQGQNTFIYLWNNGTNWYLTSTAPGVTLPAAYFSASSTTLSFTALVLTAGGTATGSPSLTQTVPQAQVSYANGGFGGSSGLPYTHLNAIYAVAPAFQPSVDSAGRVLLQPAQPSTLIIPTVTTLTNTPTFNGPSASTIQSGLATSTALATLATAVGSPAQASTALSTATWTGTMATELASLMTSSSGITFGGMNSTLTEIFSLDSGISTTIGAAGAGLTAIPSGSGSGATLAQMTTLLGAGVALTSAANAAVGTAVFSTDLSSGYTGTTAGALLLGLPFLAAGGSTTTINLIESDPLFGQNNDEYQVAIVSGLGAPSAAIGQTAIVLSSDTATGVQTLDRTLAVAIDDTCYYQMLPPILGVYVAPLGLETIATAPAAYGVTPNFRQMVVHTWRRWFRKFTAGTGGTLQGFADDGVTLLTSQTVPAPATAQTQGPSA